MLEIIFTLIFVGGIAGFIYSMPIAGPISILVVSKALQGKLRFCLRTAIGAAIMESIFVFIVVYGITALYEFYRPVLPYFLIAGAVFVIIVGFRIRKQKVDLESFASKTLVRDKYENRGGLWTGIIINLSNPTLLVTWSVASFVTLSFVSSIGLNIGGLDLILNKNIESVSQITGTEITQVENRIVSDKNILNESDTESALTPLSMSLAFALGVGIGIYLWLHILAKIFIKFRGKIKASALDKLIYSLGIILIFLGIYLGYRAVNILLS